MPRRGKRSVVAAFYPLAFAVELRSADRRCTCENLTPARGRAARRRAHAPATWAASSSADVVLYLSHDFQPAVEGRRSRRAAASGSTRSPGLDSEARSRRRRRQDRSARLARPGRCFARIVRADRRGARQARARPRRSLRGCVRSTREYRAGLAHCARREFVTSHAAFGYLAAALRPAPGSRSPGSTPRPSRAAAARSADRRSSGASTSRRSSSRRLVSPRLAETVARDAGAKTAVLDPIEGLTPAEGEQGDDYFTLMRRNLHALEGCARMPLAVELDARRLRLPAGPPVLRRRRPRDRGRGVRRDRRPERRRQDDAAPARARARAADRGACASSASPADSVRDRARIGYLAQRTQLGVAGAGDRARGRRGRPRSRVAGRSGRFARSDRDAIDGRDRARRPRRLRQPRR